MIRVFIPIVDTEEALMEMPVGSVAYIRQLKVGAAAQGQAAHFYCCAGARVMSPIDGSVAKKGISIIRHRPFHYVELHDDERNRHRLIGVESHLDLGDRVVADATIIGQCQGYSSKLRETTERYALPSGQPWISRLSGFITYELILNNGRHACPKSFHEECVL